MFAMVNGTELFFDVDGAKWDVHSGDLREKPVCFVLHGGPGGNHVKFKPHLDALTSDMQIIYIDSRGCGFSGKGPQTTYTMENNVEDIEALRNHLGLDKIMLLGHSYGGMTAMSYALRYQQYLEKLVLVSTSPSYRFIDKAKSFVAEHGTPEQQAVCDVLWSGAFTSTKQLNSYYEIMAPLYSVSVASGESREKRPTSYRSYEAINQGFGGFLRHYDIIDELPEIRVPTLVVGGKHDWITPLEESELIAKCIPDSRFVVFENSSHDVITDEPQRYSAVVSEFVREVNS